MSACFEMESAYTECYSLIHDKEVIIVHQRSNYRIITKGAERIEVSEAPRE